MRGDIPVTVIVMTRNEAANIADCLDGLYPFAQVLVVDSHSTDGTDVVAAAMGATIIPFAWNGRYPKKKQWSLSHASVRHDWVLFVDADERVSAALATEIGARVRSGNAEACAAYFISSRPVWLGRQLRFGTPYRKVALMHRSCAAFPPCDDLQVARMWEVEGHYQPVVQGPVGQLRHPLIHADAKPPSAWFDRHNRYSDWEAALAVAGPAHGGALLAGERGWRRLAKRIVRVLPGRPLLAFLYDYVWRLGVLDGKAGLHHALARAFYYWSIDLKRHWLATQEVASQSSTSGAEVSLADQSALLMSVVSPARVLTSSNVRRRIDSSGMR